MDEYRVLTNACGFEVQHAKGTMSILVYSKDVVLPPDMEIPPGTQIHTPGYKWWAERNFDGGWEDIYDEEDEA